MCATSRYGGTTLHTCAHGGNTAAVACSSRPALLRAATTGDAEVVKLL